jgi:hypothetical protein
MRRIVALAVALVAIAVPLVGADGAVAAVEAGNSCATNVIYPANTIVQLSRAAGSPLPIAAPVDGVITKWRLTNGASEEVTAQIIKVLHPTADPKAFLVVAESAFGAAVSGPNTFDTRLPVQAGDKFGLYGLKGAIACAFGTGADKLGFTSGNSTIGTTLTASAEHTSEQSPVSVVIEPDADHDGYGDETQDNCPQNPTAHSECPLAAAVVPIAETPAAKTPATPASLTIEALPQVRERSANVLVTASVESLVVASGTVRLGKGVQPLVRTPPKIVYPGRITPFTLKFRPRVRTRLKELSPAQSLKLKVLVKARDSLGRPAQIRATVPLPGQG